MTAAIELMTSPTRRRRRMPILIILSVGLIALVVLAAVLGPLLFPDAMRQDILSALLAPGQDGHLLGTDELGRDLLLRLAVGPEMEPGARLSQQGHAMRQSIEDHWAHLEQTLADDLGDKRHKHLRKALKRIIEVLRF